MLYLDFRKFFDTVLDDILISNAGRQDRCSTALLCLGNIVQLTAGWMRSTYEVAFRT